MALRGERFQLNLDPEDAYLGYHDTPDTAEEPNPSLGLDFVKDVLERKPAAPKPAEPPKFKPSASGFPAHKKRDGVSRFKQQRSSVEGLASNASSMPTTSRNAQPQGRYLSRVANVSADEQKSIDEHTTHMINSMSPEDIAEARRELLSEPSVDVIRKLLQRSTIDDTSSNVTTQPPEPQPETKPSQRVPESKPSSTSPSTKKSVSFAEPARVARAAESEEAQFDENAAPTVPPPDVQFGLPNPTPLATADLLAPKQDLSSAPFAKHNGSHPALDPNSSTFLSDLHSTYFPDLPSDPSQLEWMTPVPNDEEGASATQRHDDQSETRAENLRFDFRGNIVTRSRSESIPVNQGLHHHGKDPGSAGYTINELSIYARSTVPAQRCFAYQLLGRILFRLGKGDFGAESSSRVEGLYQEIKTGYVLEQLLKEAAREPGSGNESARVWALEAVWLWNKGGGKGLEDAEVEEEDVMGEAAERVFEEGLNPR